MKPKFKIMNKKNLYKGFFEMNELNFIHQRHDGTWSKKLKREIFSGAQVSTLLPYDPIKKEILYKCNEILGILSQNAKIHKCQNSSLLA